MRESSPELSSLDRAIVRALQGDLPLSLEPYKEIAESIKIREEDLLSRLREFKEQGIMRRVGAIIRHQRAGFSANAMAVWKVEPSEVERAGEVMASFREVSHCYERPPFPGFPYRLFCMIHGRGEEECREVAEKISQATGLEEYELLFSTRELKKTSMRYFLEEEA